MMNKIKYGLIIAVLSNVLCADVELRDSKIRQYKKEGVANIEDMKIWKIMHVQPSEVWGYTSKNITAKDCLLWGDWKDKTYYVEEEKNPVGYEQWKQCPIKTIEAYGKEGITHPSKANIDLIGVELDEWDIKYYKEKGVVDIKEIKIWKSLGITADRLYPYMKENISAEICKEWSSRASNHSVCPIKEKIGRAHV